MELKSLAINLVRVDSRIQPRAMLNEEALAEYQQLYAVAKERREKSPLPPLRCFYDKASDTYWLSRGFHRHIAAVRAQRGSLEFEVLDGDYRDAILDAMQDNDTHGVRSTNADKRKAVGTLLDDADWSKQTQQWIADKARVSIGLVRIMVSERKPKPPQQASPSTPGERYRSVPPGSGKQDSKKTSGPAPGSKGGIKAEGEKAKAELASALDLENIAPELHDRLRALQPAPDELRQLRLLEDAEQVNVLRLLTGKVKTVADALKAYESPPTDAASTEIPEHLREVMADQWYAQTEKTLKELVKVAKAKLQRNPYWTADLEPLVTALEDGARHIGDCQPKVVCPECHGDKKAAKECGWCRKTGWMPAWTYNDWKAKKGKKK